MNAVLQKRNQSFNIATGHRMNAKGRQYALKFPLITRFSSIGISFCAVSL